MLHGVYGSFFKSWFGEGEDVRNLRIDVQFYSMLTGIGEL